MIVQLHLSKTSLICWLLRPCLQTGNALMAGAALFPASLHEAPSKGSEL